MKIFQLLLILSFTATILSSLPQVQAKELFRQKLVKDVKDQSTEKPDIKQEQQDLKEPERNKEKGDAKFENNKLSCHWELIIYFLGVLLMAFGFVYMICLCKNFIQMCMLGRRTKAERESMKRKK